jgi:hypothetical protein
MKFDYKKIRCDNKDYGVINLIYKSKNMPIVVDFEDIKHIKKMDKSWKYHQNGLVSCTHTFKNKSKEIFLHNILIRLRDRSNNDTFKENPVVHLNKIGLDNRRDNIMYDIQDKNIKKNLKKKKRTLKLPEGCGITPEELPTYVWYLKPNGSHGDRFSVEIGNKKWKTTSSKKIKLKDKLEDAKTYLRNLKKESPEIFGEFSMNGDLTKTGYKLLESYKKIITKAGYLNHEKIPDLQKLLTANNTEKLLKPKKLECSNQQEHNK